MKKCGYCGKEYPDDTLICAADQTPLDSDDAAARTASSNSQAPSDAEADAGGPDGFCSLGKFEVFEAEKLLNRFTEAGIRFQIDKIDGSAFVAGGLTRGTGYVRTTAIEIFVSEDDQGKATKIIREDWKV